MERRLYQGLQQHFSLLDVGSQYGIEEGKISKLMLKRGDKTVCNYDIGWDIHPVDADTETALEILKKDYN